MPRFEDDWGRPYDGRDRGRRAHQALMTGVMLGATGVAVALAIAFNL